MTTGIKKGDQYHVVADKKIRLLMTAMADRYDEAVRDLIVKAYQDPKLHSIYTAWRRSGMFDKGGKSKVHREIARFPNAYIYDFVDTVLTAKYGEHWEGNPRALRHELVKPWWIVSKL